MVLDIHCGKCPASYFNLAIVFVAFRDMGCETFEYG